MQLRLTKENEGLLAKIGLTSGADINRWINDSLKQNSSTLYTEKQPTDFSFIIPFLSSIEESLAVMACATGRVWQRTLDKSSEKQKPIVTRNNYRDEDLPIEEQYWRPKKPVYRTLSPAQQDWVLDLVRKTINSISQDWDWDSPTGSTRDIQLVYNSLNWPADLYDQYKIYMYEWVLDNWEHKADLFKF